MLQDNGLVSQRSAVPERVILIAHSRSVRFSAERELNGQLF